MRSTQFSNSRWRHGNTGCVRIIVIHKNIYILKSIECIDIPFAPLRKKAFFFFWGVGLPLTFVDTILGTAGGTTNTLTTFDFCPNALKHFVGYLSHNIPYAGGQQLNIGFDLVDKVLPVTAWEGIHWGLSDDAGNRAVGAVPRHQSGIMWWRWLTRGAHVEIANVRFSQGKKTLKVFCCFNGVNRASV